jgi:protease II
MTQVIQSYECLPIIEDCSQTDEQTAAQAELSAYIQAQAQEIAPEPEIQFIDLDGFYTYEAQLAGQVIATITHDCGDFVTQPWVVMVGEVEIHRADTWAKCANYILWHYKQGTLPKLRAMSTEELLDLPFDELTLQEWEALKAYEPESEDVDLVAA